MQSGNLNVFFLLKQLFNWFLNKITGLSVNVNTYNVDNFSTFSSEQFLNFEAPLIKEVNPLYVLVKEKVIEPVIKINNLEMFLNNSTVQVNEMPPVETNLKWKHSNLQCLCINRKYDLSIDCIHNESSVEDIFINPGDCNSFSYDEIRLVEKVRLTEELITIMPYIKKADNSTLLKVSVLKKPLAKSYFLHEELQRFKEILAKQNKTRSSNVLITSIYDKFSVDLFSAVKQEPSTKNLICYFNVKNPMIARDKVYYLLIGERKDNRVSIKSLASLDT
jgi:hypothetical protein